MRTHRPVAFVALAAALALLGAAAPSLAAVGVAEFTGAKKKAVRERVVKALEKDGVEIAKGPPIAGSDDEKAIAKAAKKRKLDAVVTGDVELKKNKWTLTLVVRGADGSVKKETTLASGWLPGLLKSIDRKAAPAVAEALAGSGEAAEPAKVELEDEEEPAAEPPAAEGDEEKTAKEEPSEDPAPSSDAASDPSKDEGAKAGGSRGGADAPYAISLGAALRGFSRRFEWDGDVNANLRRYRLDGAPAGALAATWFPGAHVTRGAGGNVGVAATFEHSLAMSSERPAAGSGDFGSSMSAFSVGLVGRLPFGRSEAGLAFAYGSHSFEVSNDADPTATAPNGAPVRRDLLPDVSYQYLRPGLFADLRFGEIGIGASAGYRHVLSLGDLENAAWFPRASGHAFDGELHASYEVASGLDVVVGFDVRAYSVDLGSKATDVTLGRDVAEAATDFYLAGSAGARWRLPGGG